MARRFRTVADVAREVEPPEGDPPWTTDEQRRAVHEFHRSREARGSMRVYPLRLRDDASTFAEFAAIEFVRRKGSALESMAYVWGTLAQADDGRVVIGEITLAPTEAWRQQGVTAAVLRAPRPEAIIRQARAVLADTDAWGKLADRFGWAGPTDEERRRIRDAAAKAAHEAVVSPRGGRPRKPDAFYRGVALELVEIAEEAGSARGARKELARRRRAGDATVRDWLRTARDLGYLAPTTQGQASARPGPKLFDTEEER